MPRAKPALTESKAKANSKASAKVEMVKGKVAKRSTRGDGGKKKKDPNAPKRGLSAYMFFANAEREKVREDNPGISFGQVGKVLGDRWKALNTKERKPYEDLAKDDKERYEREKAAYQNKDDEDEDEE